MRQVTVLLLMDSNVASDPRYHDFNAMAHILVRKGINVEMRDVRELRARLVHPEPWKDFEVRTTKRGAHTAACGT